MYCKCGSLVDARQVFYAMETRSLVSWNSIILGCVSNGENEQALEFFSRLREMEDFAPDSRTFVAALKACTNLADREQGALVGGVLIKASNLERGRVLHSQLAKAGHGGHPFVASTLVGMYAKCGSMIEARRVFERQESRDEALWNSMILAHAYCGDGESGLEVFFRMQEQGFTPVPRTFVAALKACLSLKHERMVFVKRIHGQARRSGCELDLFVGNTLVDAYIKCGCLQDARELFEKMELKDEVTWNSMILGYAASGHEAVIALELFSRMEDEGFKPTPRTYAAAFTACATVEEYGLQRGLEIYSQLLKTESELDTYVARALVEMLLMFGRISEARRTFESVRVRDVSLWTAMVSGYAHEGELAFELFLRMQDEGMPPQAPTFVAILNALANSARKEKERKTPWLEQGRAVHSVAKASGISETDVFVGNTLINFYAKAESLEDARMVFDGMMQPDVVSWTSMIFGYIHNKDPEKALDLFREMECMGFTPDARAYCAALSACTSILAAKDNDGCDEARRNLARSECLKRGMAIHLQARSQCGDNLDEFVANSLVDLYAKCGNMAAARSVFNNVKESSVISWNALITGYVHNGDAEAALEIYRLMEREKLLRPDAVTYSAAIKAFISLGVASKEQKDKTHWLDQGRSLHASILKSGFPVTSSLVFNTLLDMYVKFGRIVAAQQLFDSIQQHSIVSWNSIVMGNYQCDDPELALELFEQMQLENFVPDSRTFVAVYGACSMLAAKEESTQMSDGTFVKKTGLAKGASLHRKLKETLGQEIERDVFVASSLVDMYAKCGSIARSREVFEKMVLKDVVSWTAVITGHAQAGGEHDGQEGLKLFARMQQEGYRPDCRTYVAALTACSSLAAVEDGTHIQDLRGRSLLVKPKSLRRGREIHWELEKEQKEPLDTFLGNTLIDMYAKCGFVAGSERVFDRMLHRDTVSWSAMILAYAQNEQSLQALHLFDLMREQGQCSPNSGTFAAVLKACVNLSYLDTGRKIHQQLIDAGLEQELSNSLIDLYAKCGSMIEARAVFSSSNRDLVAWNSLIAGFSRQGDAISVLGLLESMREQRVQPNGITFLHALGACCHAGLVDEARELFQSMSHEYGIQPRIEHYTCMVDLLGRGNHLEAAAAMVATMPFQPDSKVWMTLLGNCRKWDNVELARVAFDALEKLRSGDSAAYILMANLYASRESV